MAVEIDLSPHDGPVTLDELTFIGHVHAPRVRVTPKQAADLYAEMQAAGTLGSGSLAPRFDDDGTFLWHGVRIVVDPAASREGAGL